MVRNRARLRRLGPTAGWRLAIWTSRPTAPGDVHTAGQLLAYVRHAVRSSMSCVLISHILGEVLSTCDRIVVMRDGKVVAEDASRNLSRAKLVAAMGGVASEAPHAISARMASGARPIRVRIRPDRQTDDRELVAHEGEIVGLAGLSGHGQTELIIAAFDAAARPRPGATVEGPVALVAGDRVSDGVFPQWSIAHNIGVCSLKRLRAEPPISPRLEAELQTPGASGSGFGRPTSPTTSCRSRAATSRRRCSPARSLPTPALC